MDIVLFYTILAKLLNPFYEKVCQVKNSTFFSLLTLRTIKMD